MSPRNWTEAWPIFLVSLTFGVVSGLGVVLPKAQGPIPLVISDCGSWTFGNGTYWVHDGMDVEFPCQCPE